MSDLMERPGAPAGAAGPAAGSAAETRSRSAPLLFLLRDPLLGTVGIGLLLFGWWAVTRGDLVDPSSLPPPDEVAGGVVHLLGESGYRAEILDTIRAWALAMVLGVAIAVPLGLVAGAVAALRKPSLAVVHACRAVPLVALIPVAVLVLGLGTNMKVALTVTSISWLILLNTIYGVSNTEPQLLTVAKSLQWSRGKVLRKVVLPSALPMIATGIRVAGSVALIVILSVEIVAAGSGLGHLIIKFQADIPTHPDYAYAGIAITGTLGFIQYTVFMLLERRFVPWSHANRRQRS
ncbi:ABC transporter permease [Nocardioides sp. L-11A]|uniref:ABC transporter permease n=1 Tax=Nocardioides sp. L-11A TaxID=3043848 RepID=UPI00249CAC02|nr:ABC transporter permease [Nocardioides sp. L-11A]